MKNVEEINNLRKRIVSVIAEYMEINGYDAVAMMCKFKEDGSMSIDEIGGNK